MKDTAIALTLVGLACLAIDWLQTIYIARHPERFSETNLMLGAHPSERSVNIWFGMWFVVILGLALIILALQWQWLLAALGIFLTAVEGSFVFRNFKLHIGMGGEK